MGSPHLTGTLDRAITGVRTLMGAAMEGAETTSLRLAFDALRDQWSAAERDSRDDDVGSARRFEDVAATIYGDAFWPAIRAVSEGRDPLEDLDRASEASQWILRARGLSRAQPFLGGRDVHRLNRDRIPKCAMKPSSPTKRS